MPKQQNNESTHFFFTIRSRTTRTGQVTRLTTKGECERKALACVADIFTYDDGSEATIIDGAGSAAPRDGTSMALAGSRLSNGDTITESFRDGLGNMVRDGERVPGLFGPAYTLPPITTAGGGSSHA